MNPLNRMNPGADDFEKARAFVRAVNGVPHTGNGYGVAINPLLEEPATIDEHVALIRARGASLERWTRQNHHVATNGPIIRELIARMEGNLQGLRTLVKDMEAAGE